MKESNQPSVEGKSVGASPITSANFEVSPSSYGSWPTPSLNGGAGAQQRDQAAAGGVRSTEREGREPIPPPRPFSFQSRLTSRPASCYLVSVKVRILPLEPAGIGVTGARRSLTPQAKGRHLHPRPCFLSSARQPVTSPARHAGIARSITGADDQFLGRNRRVWDGGERRGPGG